MIEGTAVGKRLVLLLAVVCSLLPTWTASAGAAVEAHSAKFVGGYHMVLTTTDGGVFRSHLSVHANGTCNDVSSSGSAVACTWSNKGLQFTLIASWVDVRLVGTRTVRGLNSRRHPGTGYVGKKPYATWFAIKTT